MPASGRMPPHAAAGRTGQGPRAVVSTSARFAYSPRVIHSSGGLPMSAIIAIVIFLLVFLALNKLTFGRLD